MRIETKPDERSIESKLLHRFAENIHPSFDTNQRIVNGYQLMPNNSLNMYEIYTKSNHSNTESFRHDKYT